MRGLVILAIVGLAAQLVDGAPEPVAGGRAHARARLDERAHGRGRHHAGKRGLEVGWLASG